MITKKTYLFAFLISTVLFSCTPDKEDDPLAPTISDSRERYVGSWTCNETSQVSGSTAYTITISKSTSNTSEIIINRFYDIPSQSVRAAVSGNNLTIPFQQMGSVGFAKGSGSLSTSGNNLALAYTTTVSASTDSCTANCTK